MNSEMTFFEAAKTSCVLIHDNFCQFLVAQTPSRQQNYLRTNYGLVIGLFRVHIRAKCEVFLMKISFHSYAK